MSGSLFWFFYTQTAPLLAAIMGLLWLFSLWLKKISFVDSAWGANFIVLAGAFCFLRWQNGLPFGAAQIGGLVGLCLWGARLAFYLGLRFWRDGEDRRYVKILAGPTGTRSKLARAFYSLTVVFGLQGFLILIVASPITALMTGSARPLDFLAIGGLCLWGAGFLWESIADWQLMRFKKDPRHLHQVCNTGLWRYSRHPNYLGEIFVWWGLWLVSFDLDAQISLYTVISPLFITLTLLKGSGIPLNEADISARRPDYADYKRRTNALWPARPRAN